MRRSLLALALAAITAFSTSSAFGEETTEQFAARVKAFLTKFTKPGNDETVSQMVTAHQDLVESISDAQGAQIASGEIDSLITRRTPEIKRMLQGNPSKGVLLFVDIHAGPIASQKVLGNSYVTGVADNAYQAMRSSYIRDLRNGTLSSASPKLPVSPENSGYVWFEKGADGKITSTVYAGVHAQAAKAGAYADAREALDHPRLMEPPAPMQQQETPKKSLEQAIIPPKVFDSATESQIPRASVAEKFDLRAPEAPEKDASSSTPEPTPPPAATPSALNNDDVDDDDDAGTQSDDNTIHLIAGTQSDDNTIHLIDGLVAPLSDDDSGMTRQEGEDFGAAILAGDFNLAIAIAMTAEKRRQDQIPINAMAIPRETLFTPQNSAIWSHAIGNLTARGIEVKQPGFTLQK